MSNRPNTPRPRALPLCAALLFTFAPLPALVGQAYAQGAGSMPNMPGMGGGQAASATSASATGTVESVNAQQRKIKLNHEPIAAFNWPAMSMEMAAAPSIDLTKVTPGSRVRFTVSKGANGTYTVDSLSAQ